ncbi:MAG TPA: M23 family metallopeptidase [Longimicrobiales bacterium]|nr:M23 family metallopeptidase [Longimicrobiales bacterium]
MRLILLGQCFALVGIVAGFFLVGARSWLAALVQSVAALLLLAAAARVGLWLFPPWWAPWAFALAGASVLAWRLARRAPLTRLPSGRAGWSGVALAALAGTGACVVLVRAAQSGDFPPGESVDLAVPFAAGRYLVVNGGAWEVTNAHRESARSSDPRFLPWRGNGWAVDLVEVDALGRRSSGFLPVDPGAYRIYGRELVAPCAGTILIARDGMPDMPVPEYDRANLAGNHVVMGCGDVHVVLAHLRTGSVRVREGDTVAVGQPLAQVGNSGGTGEPHLHLHVQHPGPPGQPLGGVPVPMRIGGRFLVRGDRFVGSLSGARAPGR